jgi:predicted ribonuclease YlaK
MPDEGSKGRLGSLLAAEYDDRSHVLDEALAAVRAEIQHWSRPGVLVVADTSFYLRHPDKIEEADIASLLPIREEPIRVIVPILVVDELDRLKQSGESTVRWRAAYTLAVLDRLLPAPTQSGRLRAEDFSALDQGIGGIPRGEVSVEILFDPPGHLRLPIADDEIVDRALAAQTRSGQPVTFLTYDTGQAMRARYAGLETKKLATKMDPEP